MNEVDALELLEAAIRVVIVAASPMVLAAMAVGIVIALFQALTQVQEMTLTFVPKILVTLLVAALTASFMGGTLYAFTTEVYSRIERPGE
jgi:flagellar biosynthetic protein FliQ